MAKPANYDQLSEHYLLADLGYAVVVRTETLQRFSKRKNDLLGFADFLAYDDTRTTLIQVTSRKNMKARWRKITQPPRLITRAGRAAPEWDADIRRRAREWLNAPSRDILILGWSFDEGVGRWVAHHHWISAAEIEP